MIRPTTATTRGNDPRGPDFESLLDAFEDQLEHFGQADLTEFLPSPNDSVYCSLAAELVRIDLERAWARGIDRRLEDYRAIVPQLFDERASLSDVAYEEYRLRRQAGESVDPSDYAQRYSIDTSSWPAWHESAANKANDSNEPFGKAPSSHAQFPAVGEKFAGFDLVEQLGQGAFGTVFRAVQHDLAAREVVIKITAERSIEPQRLAKLQHTNIVPIYSVHRAAGLLGICMPFLGRRTLADILTSGRPDHVEAVKLDTIADRTEETIAAESPAVTTMDDLLRAKDSRRDNSSKPHGMGVPAAIELVAQLAEGLAHAHSRGIVHSDLKPANVLLGDDDTPLLLDFNLSRDVCAEQRGTLLVGGTLPYMAPEHLQAILDGGATQPVSDVYSLGAIFFEMLSGQRPFPPPADSSDDSVPAMIRERRCGASSVRSFNHAVSPAVASIVARCLAADVGRRYSGAAELADDLRRHLADLPLRHAADPSLRERVRKWLRRHAQGIRVAAVATLLGLLATSIAMYAARQNRLARLEASAAYADFQRDALTAKLNLNVSRPEPALHRIGRAAAEHALQKFVGDEIAPRTVSADFSYLSPTQQVDVRKQSDELRYALADSSADRQRLSVQDDMSADARAYFHAQSLLENHEYAAATPAWEKLREANPQDPVRWLLLGNAYKGNRRLVDAAACYTAVIALQPKAMEGYYCRGLCRFELRQYADAEHDFSAVLGLRPGLFAVLLNRALTCQALGAFESAERDATAAIEGGVKDPRAFFVRALIRNARGNIDGAKADRKRGFELAPVDDTGWAARGMAILNDDPQRACDEFEAGLERFPDSTALLQNLVHVDGDRLHRPELAMRWADRWVELSPDDPAALAGRAVLHARRGDREAALADAARVAAARVPPVTALQLACIYSLTSSVQSADGDESLRLLQQALAQDPRLAARAYADPDLELVSSKPEFKSLVAAAIRLTSHSASTPPDPTESLKRISAESSENK